MLALTSAVAIFASLVLAAPAPAPELEARQSITTMSTSQVTAFRPYTHYASAAYCQPASTLAWNCGSNCQANPSFKPIASGGDGSGVQFCQFHALVCCTCANSTFRRVRRVGLEPGKHHRCAPGDRSQQIVSKVFVVGAMLAFE